MDDLFGSLHRGLYLVIFGKIPRPRMLGQPVQFTLSAPTPEDLVVDFVNEVTYYIFTRRLLLKIPGKVACNFAKLWRLEALYDAVPIAELPYRPQTEVKSATYHNLHINYVDGKFQTSVVLDI
ncbi:MAG: archease [bacterium JZ-2024 1]